LDNNTSHTVVGNLAAMTAELGDDVNSYLYRDGGHAVNEDAGEFIAWVTNLTGYRR
jgi:4-diphosphocytidyl-2C-methyl-D-erythritol kinase